MGLASVPAPMLISLLLPVTDERNDDENCPREERGPIIQRASLQKREHEEHEENEERHGDTSFLGEK